MNQKELDMEETCELCRQKTGQHRRFFTVVRYRNDQRDGTRELGVFCEECAKTVLIAVEGAIHEVKEGKHG
jgi:hypothetical protein